MIGNWLQLYIYYIIIWINKSIYLNHLCFSKLTAVLILISNIIFFK